MSTTYRALCAELVAAFNSYHLFTDAETTTAWQRAERVNQAITAAVAALKAEPEGEGPSVEQMYYWALKSIYKYGSDTLSEQADDRGWLRAAVAEMVRRAQESLDYGTPVAQPAPEVSNKQIEAAAKLIYASMRSAATDSHGACDWVERGNSLMQDEARRTARAILARCGIPTTPPAPEPGDVEPDPNFKPNFLRYEFSVHDENDYEVAGGDGDIFAEVATNGMNHLSRVNQDGQHRLEFRYVQVMDCSMAPMPMIEAKKPATPPAPESEEMQGLVIDLTEVSLVLDTMKGPRLAAALTRAATLLQQQATELAALRGGCLQQ